MNSTDTLCYFCKFTSVFIHSLLGLLDVIKLVNHLMFYIWQRGIQQQSKGHPTDEVTVKMFVKGPYLFVLNAMKQTPWKHWRSALPGSRAEHWSHRQPETEHTTQSWFLGKRQNVCLNYCGSYNVHLQQSGMSWESSARWCWHRQCISLCCCRRWRHLWLSEQTRWHHSLSDPWRKAGWSVLQSKSNVTIMTE